jgi:hypothetical protein
MSLTQTQLQILTKKDFDSSISIAPSDRVYFGEYPYRVDIHAPQHPHPKHDPIAHFAVTDIMRTSMIWWKRERSSTYKRSIYLANLQDVKWLCNWVPEQVTRIVGPVSKKHLSILTHEDYILRQSLFYGKYNYRVELSFFQAPYNMNRRPKINEIMDFVLQNFEDYRWSHNHLKWYYNFLYCNEKEFNALQGFMNISFGNCIKDHRPVYLLSQL